MSFVDSGTDLVASLALFSLSLLTTQKNDADKYSILKTTAQGGIALVTRVVNTTCIAVQPYTPLAATNTAGTWTLQPLQTSAFFNVRPRTPINEKVSLTVLAVTRPGHIIFYRHLARCTSLPQMLLMSIFTAVSQTVSVSP
jgi:hypothetical protein